MRSGVQDERSLFAVPEGSVPYEFLAESRAQCPVHWDPGLGGYLLTRYDDVFTAMSKADEFREQSRPEEQYAEHQLRARVATFRNLLSSRATAPHVDTIVRPVIDKLISRFERDGEAELHGQLAHPFPARVIGLMFGLEESDFDALIAYRDARSLVFDAPAGPQAEELARTAATWQERVYSRMREVLAAHRDGQPDDLLTALMAMREDGQSIPDEEMIELVVRDVLMGGSETAMRSTCNAIYRALSLPGMRERLRADPSLVPAFVEESLRIDPPVHVHWRAANHDTEMSGCPIAKDSQIYPSLAAANHDPDVFVDPEGFDMTRSRGRSLTFGVGPHRCPGHWLGRRETELALSMLLERLPNVRLDPDAVPPRFEGVILRAWMPLHVRFDPLV